MPPASLDPSSPYQSPHDTTVTSQTLHHAPESVQTPRPSRSNPLARLRFPSSTSLRPIETSSPLDNARKEFTMSFCSDATTFAHIPTSASELTLAPSFAGSETHHGGKHDPKSFARALVHRSSRMFGKRSASKTSLVSLGTDYSGSDSRRTSIESTRRPATSYSRASSRTRLAQDASAPQPPKIKISQPFNFQHLAHTAPIQAMTALRQLTSDGLETEFSALQAGQTPSDQVKHIDADHLRPTTSDGSIGSAGPTSPPSSPSKEQRPSLRSLNSVDSFKRQSKSFSQPFFPQGPTPPTRTSSRRRPPQLITSNTMPPRVESPAIPDFTVQNRPKTAPSPKSPLRIATSAATTPLGLTGVVHAVTTPDDSAFVLMSDCITPLEDVPEEEDSFFPLQPRRLSKARNSKEADGPTKRMLRSGSDPVLPESAASAEDIPSRISQRISTNPAGPQNWDDDIDYCYDHALDADAEAEAMSELTSPVSDVEEMVFMRDHPRRSSETSRATVRRSSATPVPPLHLRKLSGHNLATRTTTLEVPNMMDAPMDSAGNVMFTLSPSMIIPREYNQDESLFESQQQRPPSNKGVYQSQMPMFTPSMGDLKRNFGSPRSSATYSSSDSTRNSGLATDSTSSISTASVPDLVLSGSQHNRKSFGNRSTASSSIHSQLTSNGDANNVPPTPTLDLSPMATLREDPDRAEPTPVEGKEADDTLSEMPVTVGKAQPMRARAQSESASRALAQEGASAPASAKASHGRSASSAATATTKSPKPTYSLFPPLDRIGATSSTTPTRP